jgi:hypothetical protein
MKILRKIIVLSLMLTMMVQVVASANTGDQQLNSDLKNQNLVENTIKILGIMTGDEKGNMNLEQDVSREQFAKMIIMASKYKDDFAKDSNYSVFKDVKHDRWSASYIKLAVDMKLFTGYIDGTFKPENKISLEEAATVVLRLLGYENSDFNGTYPMSQLSKYKSLGLDKNIDKIKGQYLSRKDCMNLFYNLMNAKTKSGVVYASSIGHMLSTNQEIDYNALLKNELVGPVVISENNLNSILPFSSTEAIVYRDGVVSKASDIKTYDVIYYNQKLKTIWAYSKKITGMYTNAIPNISTPDTVTVAGNTYKLSSSISTHKMSATGEFSIGDSVVLLLGINGDVVDVISADKIENSSTGVVVSTNKIVTDAGSLKNEILVAYTDGTTSKHEFLGSISVGNVVSVEYRNGNLKISRASDKYINLSDYKLAENVEILDVNEYGEYCVVYPSRLGKTALSGDDIKYYSLNSSGQIDRLILNNVTGDLGKYGIVTSSQEIDKTENNTLILQGFYQYLIDGKPMVLNTQNSIFNIDVGPAIFSYEKGQVSSIRNLSSVDINSVAQTFILSENQKYMLAQDVQVYLKNDGNYYLTELSSVSNLEKYNLKAYVDSGYKAGKKVRIIIATNK